MRPGATLAVEETHNAQKKRQAPLLIAALSGRQYFLQKLSQPFRPEAGPLSTGGAAIGTAKSAQIVGHQGEQSGTVYRITVGRDDLGMKDHGAKIRHARKRSDFRVVANNHHRTDEKPLVIFLHYWGRGPADKLANSFKAALDELGKGGPHGMTR